MPQLPKTWLTASALTLGCNYIVACEIYLYMYIFKKPDKTLRNWDLAHLQVWKAWQPWGAEGHSKATCGEMSKGKPQQTLVLIHERIVIYLFGEYILEKS